MAIEEAVGRATELGKPVHYNPGLGDLVSEVAPQTLAGLDILSYVARTCARYNADLIVTNRNAVVHPITEEIVRQAFLAEGVADKLKPETVRFLSEEQFAYAASAMGIIQREQAAANIRSERTMTRLCCLPNLPLTSALSRSAPRRGCTSFPSS